MNVKPLMDEPVVVKQSERVNLDGAMKPVTDYAGKLARTISHQS